MIQIRKKLIAKLKILLIERRRRRLEDMERKMEKERLKRKSRYDKKIVYNNSSRELSMEEIELLTLGLNFGLASKRFPLVEYIVATEKLCLSLEEEKADESIEKAQKIRNLVMDHIRKGLSMTIEDNLTKNERVILQTLKKDTSIIICPADKGKAVVIEDRDAYLRKMQDQIDEGDYQLAKGNEKKLLNKIHRRLMAQLKEMGLTEFGERRPFMVTAPVMANMYLLEKRIWMQYCHVFIN